MNRIFIVLAGLAASVNSVVAETNPQYNADWPYKVTQHSTDWHQSCSAVSPVESGCDHIIGPDTYSNSIRIKPGKTMPLPGEKVCILPGTYNYAEVFKTHGEEGAPITIQNCGGLVKIDAEFRVMESSHLAIKGDGDKDTLYGMKVTGKQKVNTASALSITRFSRDVEVAYTDISAPLGRAALHFNSAKPKKDSDGNYIKRFDPVTGDLFVQTNSHIHHNYIHDSLEGEGIYLGIAGCGEEEFEAGAGLENTYVHDNIVINNGADGVQIGCGRDNTFVYNNYIETAGFNPFRPNAGHTKGIQVGAGTSGHVFNNFIKNIKSDCVFIGSGPTLEQNRDIALSVYNNIGTDCEHAAGFHSSVKNAIEAGQKFAIANNTFVNMRSGHYWLNQHFDDLVRVDLKNNLYVDASRSVPHTIVNGTNQVSENFNELTAGYYLSFQEVGFVDGENEDFSLEASSPALDIGVDASDLDVVLDMTGLPRLHNDLGAIEFRGVRTDIPDLPDNDVVYYDHYAMLNIAANGRSTIRFYAGEHCLNQDGTYSDGNCLQNRLHISQPGFEFLQFDISLLDGAQNLESMFLLVAASFQTKQVPLSNYIQELNSENQRVTISFEDFGFSAGKLEGGLYEIGIKTTSSVGNGLVKLDEITVGNSERQVVWHGDSRPAQGVFNTNPTGLNLSLESEKIDNLYAAEMTVSSNGRVYLIKESAIELESIETTELTFKIKADVANSDINLDELFVGMQAGGNRIEIALADYVDELSDDFNLVSIPLAHFSFKEGKLEKGIHAIGFKSTSRTGTGTLYIDDIYLVDSQSSNEWYTDTAPHNSALGNVWQSNPGGFSYRETIL